MEKIWDYDLMGSTGIYEEHWGMWDLTGIWLNKIPRDSSRIVMYYLCFSIVARKSGNSTDISSRENHRTTWGCSNMFHYPLSCLITAGGETCTNIYGKHLKKTLWNNINTLHTSAICLPILNLLETILDKTLWRWNFPSIPNIQPSEMCIPGGQEYSCYGLILPTRSPQDVMSSLVFFLLWTW